MQKRIQYVKTSSGLEKQLIASAADIVEIDAIDGLDADNVQDALEALVGIANNGGVTGVKGDNETEYRTGQVNITKDNIGLGNVTNDAQVKRSEMGQASGVATLDTSGKVPSTQLPSYVDDVIIGEYYNGEFVGLTGETDKIYVDNSTNKTYRWAGDRYVEISASLALGETSSTAYAGDKGKANADDIATLKERAGNIEGAVDDIKDGTITVKKSESAAKLTTGRKITLKGDATGETTFDGSADKEISVTLSNSGVTAGTYSVVSVDAKGRVTTGSQIVEWGTSGQSTPSANLAVGGLFFELVE